MPAKTWKLIGFGSPNQIRISGQQFNVSPRDLGNTGAWQVLGHALDDGLRAGVDVVEINNGAMTFEAIPTRGMGIHRAWLKDDREVPTIGWKSPVRGPVHPAFVDLGEPSGLGRLDGFDELFVRCGLESNGAPDFDDTTQRLKYPLHGRIANKPAHEVEPTVHTYKQEIALRGVVEDTRFHFLKLRMTCTISTKFGSKAFTGRDEVENFSVSPTNIQMLYHVNFGLSLLDGG